MTHLCNLVLWEGLEVWRREGEPAVSSCIVREKIQRHILFPLVAVTQVNALHAHKPVWARNETYEE